MGKTYKESHFPGSKQSGKAAEYQSKKKVRHSKMQPFYIKLKEKEEMKKKFLSETLPRIKEANKRREAAYLAAIGK